MIRLAKPRSVKEVEEGGEREVGGKGKEGRAGEIGGENK